MAVGSPPGGTPHRDRRQPAPGDARALRRRERRQAPLHPHVPRLVGRRPNGDGRPGALRTEDRLFRYADGHPLTGRRFDTISRLLKKHLPWAAQLDCGPHTLRHTTLNLLRHVTTPEVVAAIAGHTEPGTARHYKPVTFAEMRQALERLFGPLDAERPHGCPSDLLRKEGP